MYLWKRYFFVELLKTVLFFIGSFYFLYVMIDFSTHTKIFRSEHISFLDSVLYYARQFTKRADVLIPVALLVSTIKVLTISNLRNEIVALTTNGISLKKILSPFLWMASICALLLYLNFQFLYPFSVEGIAAFEEHFFKGHGKATLGKKVHALFLEDNSLLIYQTYNPEALAFFDVFWLQNQNRIYKIRSLLPYENIPLGESVDLLIRSSDGEVLKEASFDRFLFTEMRFDHKALSSAVHPPRTQSISELARHLVGSPSRLGLFKMNDKEAEVATFFYFKLTIPLLCFLAVIGPAPFCLRCTRNLPVFFIYALSLFGIITFFTVINSAILLGESQVLPPIIAILLPQTLFFLIVGWKYAKL